MGRENKVKPHSFVHVHKERGKDSTRRRFFFLSLPYSFGFPIL
jgi:hypothetical protein